MQSPPRSVDPVADSRAIPALGAPAPTLVDLLLSGRPRNAPRPLSPRQTEVAHLVAKGLRNQDVAVQLAISERTVRNHLVRVFRKLAVRNRTMLARWVLGGRT